MSDVSMPDINTARLQLVHGGSIMPIDAGPLQFYRPLSSAVIGVAEDGTEVLGRVMHDFCTGTMSQILAEFRKRLEFAFAHALGVYETIPRDADRGAILDRWQRVAAFQTALGKNEKGLDGFYRVPLSIGRSTDHIERKVLYGLPEAQQNGKLEATPAAARRLAAQLLAWAEAEEKKTT